MHNARAKCNKTFGVLMFSAILRHLFGAYAALLFLLILDGRHSCSARTNNNYCALSSCGNIHNISYPFRLNTDPKSCGHKNYELVCENKRPTLYLNKVKYYVQAIEYSNFTVRLVDAAVQKDDCFSIPQRSFIAYDRYLSYRDYLPFNFGFDMLRTDFNTFKLTFMSCANRILSLPDFIVDASSCKNGSSAAYNSMSSSISSPSSLSMEGYSYVMVAADFLQVPDLCRVNLVYSAPESLLPENRTNMSYRDVHDILLYGFELSWYSACCDSVKEIQYCNYDGTYCDSYGLNDAPIRVALDFLTNRILSYLSMGPLARYFPSGTWIYYSRRGKPHVGFRIYKDYYNYVGTKDISSDILSIIIVLLIALFFLTVIYRTILFFIGLLCLITLLIYKWRRRHLSMYNTIEEFLQRHDNLMPIRYSYSEIKKITNEFKDKLGEGGCGSVYKGKLRSGSFAAVKILGKSKGNGQEFTNEVATIGRIHHVNVVQLIGFTAEGSRRGLIYEFMPNGSLDKHIFSRKDSNITLSKEKMYEISLGIARGIDYLHQGCDMQILHFDIKPHNILLDEKFVPKISDFGLAKLYPTNKSIVPLTAVRGTMGYIAPELFYKNIGGISYKADVYSFGMLLMDIIGRRKNLSELVDHSSQIYFPSWVYEQVCEGNDLGVLGDTTEQEKKTTKKMIIVASWCIQLKPDDRPSMHEVVIMLEADVESLQMPPKPFLGTQQMPKDDDRARLSNPPTYSIDFSYQIGR